MIMIMMTLVQLRESDTIWQLIQTDLDEWPEHCSPCEPTLQDTAWPPQGLAFREQQQAVSGQITLSPSTGICSLAGLVEGFMQRASW